jgi:hypothetical protein
MSAQEIENEFARNGPKKYFFIGWIFGYYLGYQIIFS